MQIAVPFNTKVSPPCVWLTLSFTHLVANLPGFEYVPRGGKASRRRAPGVEAPYPRSSEPGIRGLQPPRGIASPCSSC